MSDCPGVLRTNQYVAVPVHCEGCAENARLRARMVQRTAALQALRDWVDDEESCATLDALIAQADRALADLPDAPKGEP